MISHLFIVTQCVLTVLPIDLTLRDDNLAGVDVACVGNGMVQDADGPDHLAEFGRALQSVAGVADQLFALGKLEKVRGGEGMSSANHS